MQIFDQITLYKHKLELTRTIQAQRMGSQIIRHKWFNITSTINEITNPTS